MTPTLLPAWRAALLPLALAWPLASMAQQPAVTAPHSVQMRAGPDPSYPIVAVLPPRVGVTVFGCLEGYTWCDVGAGYDRGWVYAGNLRYYYQSQYVPLVGIASVVGIGFTAFAFNDYWGRHYREQRFYAPEDRWHRGPPPRAWGFPQASGYAPGYGPHRAPGFAPNHGQMPDRPMAQPAQQGQLAPTRPNGGQPGMHAPQSHGMQPAPQAAMQPPAHGVMPPRPVPQGNPQAQQRAKGDVIHNDRKHGGDDEKKH